MKIKEIKTYYINIDKDEEKRDSMEKMLSSLGFTNYERFSGIESEFGCEKSHYKLLSQNPETPFIVLEDDCSLKTEVIEMEIPDDIDMIYLGVSAFGYYNGNISTVAYKEISEEVSRVYNMLSTHAMLYLSKRYVKVVKHLANHCGNITSQVFDKAIAEISKYFEVYALNDPFFYQNTYNKPHTYYDLRSYKTTQSVDDDPTPKNIRSEPIQFNIND